MRISTIKKYKKAVLAFVVNDENWKPDTGWTLIISCKAREFADTRGELDWNIKRIFLDLEQTVGVFLSTLVHELLHISYEQLPDKKINQIEREIYKDLSALEKTALLRRIGASGLVDE